MNYRIVADSSSNVLSMANPRYFSVPMKVRAEKEYIDNEQLDVAQMVADLRNHKGTSGSSCPNVGEWLDAFGDADFVFGTTMCRPPMPSWRKIPARRPIFSTPFLQAPSRCS